jgi:hypothetical protein
MNKVQAFRRQLMRRNFHLNSSVAYEILSSRAGAHNADSAIWLIRAAGAAPRPGTRSMARGKIRQPAVIRRIALEGSEFAGFSTALAEMASDRTRKGGLTESLYR